MVEYVDNLGRPIIDIQKEVLYKLAEAWNLFQSIPKSEKHVCDADEFCKAIHAAQNIMYAELYIKIHGQC